VLPTPRFSTWKLPHFPQSDPGRVDQARIEQMTFQPAACDSPPTHWHGLQFAAPLPAASGIALHRFEIPSAAFQSPGIQLPSSFQGITSIPHRVNIDRVAGEVNCIRSSIAIRFSAGTAFQSCGWGRIKRLWIVEQIAAIQGTETSIRDRTAHPSAGDTALRCIRQIRVRPVRGSRSQPSQRLPDLGSVSCSLKWQVFGAHAPCSPCPRPVFKEGSSP